MTKDDELKESVKEPIKSLVKEIVSDTVYKLVKAAAKKTVVELRDKLKEEAARRLEEKLKQAAEKRLKQTAKKLENEFTEDTPRSSDYIKELEQSFRKRLRDYLSPLSKGLLKPILISCICAAFVGASVGGYAVYSLTKTTPPQSQPDLIISEITFEIEAAPKTELLSEEEVPSELYAVSLWPWGDNPLYQVTIHYVIENQGGAEAGQSTSCLFLNGEVVAEAVVGSLAAGETAEGAFYDYILSPEVIFPFFASGHIDVEIRADAGNAIEESNEENNSATLIVNLPY